MSSIISASTTSATALNLTADTSGQLEIKTGSTPTTALTIDTSQNATFAGTLAATGRLVASSMPTGSVLQVVNGTTTTETSASTGTFVDTTLSASITPSSASSKILVLVNQVSCGKSTNDVTLQLKLLRNSTDLIRFEAVGAWTASASYNFVGSCSTCYLDSPSTTSSITYKTQMCAFSPGAAVYTQFNVGAGAPTSTITLIEVKG